MSSSYSLGEPEVKKFYDGIFPSLITTLMPEKRRFCGGKAFFCFVGSKLGRQSATEGKENAEG